MKERVLIEFEETLQDIVDATYRASFYLGLGYGMVYYGPKVVDVDEDGNVVESEDSWSQMVLEYISEPEKVGFNRDKDKEDQPVSPTVKNPVVNQMVQESAIGDFQQESEEDVDYDEEDSYSVGKIRVVRLSKSRINNALEVFHRTRKRGSK